MQRIVVLAISCAIVILATTLSGKASEGRSLKGMISEWQYPGSKINGASMSDGETVNSAGDRTLRSIKCKTVLTTSDSMRKVIDYYETKNKLTSGTVPPKDETTNSKGRSVTFHDDSDGRPLAVHIIVVNTEKASTAWPLHWFDRRCDSSGIEPQLHCFASTFTSPIAPLSALRGSATHDIVQPLDQCR